MVISFGRGTRTRTQKNGFGDRYVTITSCPYDDVAAAFLKSACSIVIDLEINCKLFSR